MLIQEFCRVTGLSRDTVRFYVRQGLLTPAVGAGAGGTAAAGRPSNRYRVFDAAQVERARLIRAAQALGFTLREIAALAATYEAAGLTRARKVEVLRAHLAALEERAAQLAAVRRYVRAKLAWLGRGEVGPPPRLATPAPAPRHSAPRAPEPRVPAPHARLSRRA